MRKLLLACALFLIWPVAASSGPKEDALLVVEQFKKAFDASDVKGVVKLFAPDAVFLGTVKPGTGDEDGPDRQVFSGVAAIHATLHHD
jgi:ketosteroid isomerase-like protein